MKKFIAFTIITSVLTSIALAGEYWSQDVIATNSIFQPGFTNLSGANYQPAGRYVNLHGANLTASSQNILLEFVCGQYVNPTNSAATTGSVIATLVPVFDDYSIAFKDALPTNYAFNVTFTVPAQANYPAYATNAGTVYSYPNITNCSTYLAQVNATNFLGAKYFTCTSLAYSGANAVAVKHFRAGAWVTQ